jgi:Tol biopolymer transport system component
LLVAAFVLAVASFNRLFRSERAPHRPPAYKQVTFLGDVRYPVLSADGKHLAYTARKKTGEYGLWVKDLDTGSAIETYSAPRCWLMGWSPDGSHLLFGAIHQETDMGTCIIPRLGGEPRKIFDNPWPWSAWSPDGSRIANLGVGVDEISIIDLSTGDTRVIELSVGAERAAEFNFLDWSRTHDLLLFQMDDAKHQSLWTIKPDGTGQALLMEVAYDPKGLMANPRWSPRGDAVYYVRFSVRGQGVMDLMKIPIDTKTGAKTGNPLTVLSGLHTGDEGYSISEDGTRFLYVQETNYANLWMVTVQGEAGSFDVKKMQLTTGATWKSRAEISPDGSCIAFGMSTGEASNIYVMTLPDEVGGTETGESPRQLTFFNSLTDVPVWSPDGSEIAFFWNRERENPPMGTWVKDMTTGRMWKIADTVVQPLAWTPDGEWIWGMRYDIKAGGLNDVFKIPAGGGEPVHWVNLPFDKVDSGRISLTPDGRTYIYSKSERHADAWIVEDFDPDDE